MNCVIIEDEKLASNRLIKMIETHLDHLSIEAVIGSVEESIKYLEEHKHPNLIFMDVQLIDGLGFDILERIEVDVPIIFISGHDRYALKAHRARAVDYLLKPITKENLISAVGKISALPEAPLEQTVIEFSNTTSFIVQFGSRYYVTDSEEVAYFQNIENVTMMTRKDGIKLPIKLSIKEAIVVLPSYQFFQISNNLIISIDAIKYLHYQKDIPCITLDPEVPKTVSVAKEFIPSFNQWLQKQYS
jgi:DNA-binding LytR/AlgR family response regulator